MKQREQFVAAIDIGTTKIVSIVGKKNENGKIEILGLSKAPSNGVKRGVVLNIEETVNAIQKTVEDVQQRSDIAFTDVFVGIAGQHIKSMKSRGYINRDSSDDEIQKEDVFKLTQDMHKIPIEIGEEIIHVIPQNFIVDNETGHIYRVLERYADPSDRIKLDRPWEGGSLGPPDGGWVWAVPRPVAGGRSPRVAVYQEVMRF